MILRLILILLVIWLAFAFGRYLKQLGKKPSTSRRPDRIETGRMVRCDHCGTHLPAEHAIQTDTGTYCCIEHRDLRR